MIEEFIKTEEFKKAKLDNNKERQKARIWSWYRKSLPYHNSEQLNVLVESTLKYIGL